MMKLGAEAILTVILAPFFIWIVVSIYGLQNSYAELRIKTEYNREILTRIESNLEYIRQKLEK